MIHFNLFIFINKSNEQTNQIKFDYFFYYFVFKYKSISTVDVKFILFFFRKNNYQVN